MDGLSLNLNLALNRLPNLHLSLNLSCMPGPPFQWIPLLSPDANQIFYAIPLPTAFGISMMSG